MDDIQQNKSLKARLHRRFLSQQLDAIFVAAKLHQVSNMFETPAISRRQIWKSHLVYKWDFEVATLARQKKHLVAAKKIAQMLASLKNDKRNRNSFLAWSVPRAVDLCSDSVSWIPFDLHMLKYAFLKKKSFYGEKKVALKNYLPIIATSLYNGRPVSSVPKVTAGRCEAGKVWL